MGTIAASQLVGMHTKIVLVSGASVSEIESHVEAWTDLSQHALDPNPYLMPHFLIPAYRHLAAGDPFSLLFIYGQPGHKHHHGHGKLLLVMPIQSRRATVRFPCRKASTNVYKHSYLSYPLIRDDAADVAVASLLSWFRKTSPSPVLMICGLPDHTATATVLVEGCMRHKTHFLLHGEYLRSTIIRRDSAARHLQSLPKDMRRNAGKLLKKLETLGRVSILHYGNDCDRLALAERFMQLESSGWKGRKGSALASAVADRGFFLDLVKSADENMSLFFTEIRLDDLPIAMTANFIVGEHFFAFKIGSLEHYKKYSPGIAMELASIKLMYAHAGFRFADSGAGENSFIQRIWPDTQRMTTLYVAGRSARGIAALRFFKLSTQLIRVIRHPWRRILAWLRPQSAPSASSSR